MIGRLHHVVLDCPEPAALAAFYSRLLGQPVTYRSDEWVVVAANDSSSGLAFQLAPDHRRPSWPDPAVPQQVHLDIMVEDVASSGPLVLALGARKLDGEDVYADPAGHPFCLIRRPGWARPIPRADAGEPGPDGGAELALPLRPQLAAEQLPGRRPRQLGDELHRSGALE
jgi:catechol 2,3-dioxygenase-like lactoylglutathione lyase family enzyme